jgi:drug/metabolite transporter (DMT)-like permease
VLVVALALASAALFGAMTVAIRLALRPDDDTRAVALATVLPAFAVGLAAALVRHDAHGAWPFFLAGLLAPGGSQLLFTLAVREAGASRTSVTVGAAPLVAVAIALVFLGEPLRIPLLVGAVLVVAGGVELARERERPQHLRRIGLLYAFAGATLFAIRDNLVRHLATGVVPAPPGVAATAALLGGGVLVVAWARRGVGRRWLPFLPAGLLFGASYVSLFEAYYRGRVTVVAPLVAMESLFGVLLSFLLLRHSEVVGRRLVIGAVLIVAGGGLIGTVR